MSKIEGIKDSNLVFLASETFSCIFAAQVISTLCQEFFGVEPEIKIIEGIQVLNPVLFRETGVRNYLKCLAEYGSMLTPDEIIINITGGFKAILPVATMIGNVLGHRVVYVFERSDELITIPPLPVSVDVELWGRYAHVLKEMDEKPGDCGEPNFFNEEDKNYFSPFFERFEKGFRLSYLGELFYNKYKSKHRELLRREKGRVIDIVTGGSHSTMWGGDEVRGLGDIPEADAKKVFMKIMEYPVVKKIILGSFNGASGQAYNEHFVELYEPKLSEGKIFGKIKGKGKKHNWQTLQIQIDKGMEIEFFNEFENGIVKL